MTEKGHNSHTQEPDCTECLNHIWDMKYDLEEGRSGRRDTRKEECIPMHFRMLICYHDNERA